MVMGHAQVLDRPELTRLTSTLPQLDPIHGRFIFCNTKLSSVWSRLIMSIFFKKNDKNYQSYGGWGSNL